MNLVLLKLGGSAITKKSENKPEVNREVLHNIAMELNLSIKKNEKQKSRNSKFSLILIHGAGPFGHSLVKKYGINNGMRTKKQFEGVKKTLASVRKLNDEVMRELVSAGIDAINIAPFDVLSQKNKRICAFDVSGIELLVSNGFVPVLFGDMVNDSELNYSVVSGDAIIAFLAKKFKAKKVFMGTDVDGIYSDDPKKNRNTKKIKEINSLNCKEAFKCLKEASTIDVTGGMRGKILELKRNLKGIEIIVFDITKKGNLRELLEGKNNIGTKIYFK